MAPSVDSAATHLFARCADRSLVRNGSELTVLGERTESLMSIIAWILLGLVAGVIAKALMPGNDPGGFIVTILIGIVGAVVGGFLWNLLTGNDSYGDFDIGGILIAVAGSIILLAGYRRFAAHT